MFRDKIITFFAFFAKLLLRIYKPSIILIAGTDGKTSSAFAIAEIIKKNHTIYLNHNEDLLSAILSLFHIGRGPKSLTDYLIFFFRILWFLLWPRNYPDFLIIEIESEQAGDMNIAGAIFRPDVLIFPSMVVSPENAHFQNNRSIQREYASLLQYLPPDGYIIANADDNNCFAMTRASRDCRTFSYGFHSESDLQLSDHRTVYAEAGSSPSVPAGIDFSINYNGEVIGCHRANTVSRLHAYTGAAAFAVSVLLEIPHVLAADTISRSMIAPGRMKLLTAVKGAIIIDLSLIHI